jgi:hypothetical protein
MADKFITKDLASVIGKRSKPAITVWNRLEGRPRADNFERALRAEVRDALWMLTRQWQMGEFRGEDAGSPFFAKVHLHTSRLHKYQPANGSDEAIDDAVPLEPHVERRPLRFSQAGRDIALDLRLLMGRQWLKMIGALEPAAVAGFLALPRYRVHSPDPTDPADATTCAHPEAWSDFAAASGRCLDGYKLYEYLVADPSHHAADDIAALAGRDADVDPIALRFVSWLDRLVLQPAGDGGAQDAWLPDRLEYRFAVSSPTATAEKVLAAEEYFHGHLDWYNFDVDPGRTALGTPAPAAPQPHTFTMLPAPVKFNGMPNTRWWKFEDGRTNFGDVKPDTTDLAKLLLIEFGLVYANDWFMVPFTVPAGSLALVRGMAVVNVFGERTWVDAAGSGLDDDWQRWAMFLLSTQGDAGEAADLSLLVPPVAQQVLEGRPLEEVLLARDEMANMVWAIEHTVALPSGRPRPGREAAQELRGFFERDLERRQGQPPQPLPPAVGAKIRYQVMSSVPEHWIPMIPVHVAGDNREVQLQRAAMPRVLVGDPAPPVPVRPRTSLLREGIEAAQPYFLHEEEVQRAGVRVAQCFQRVRTRDGRACVWLGVRKQSGRGEGSSGLAFDRLVDIPPPA